MNNLQSPQGTFKHLGINFTQNRAKTFITIGAIAAVLYLGEYTGYFPTFSMLDKLPILPGLKKKTTSTDEEETTIV